MSEVNKEKDLKIKNVKLSKKYFTALVGFYGYEKETEFRESAKGQEILNSFQNILETTIDENRKALKLNCTFSKYRDQALE